MNLTIIYIPLKIKLYHQQMKAIFLTFWDIVSFIFSIGKATKLFAC